MRNLRVRREIDIDAIEHDPFAVRRRHRRADAFQRHHVFERERMLLRRRLRLCKSRRGKEKYDYEKFLHEAQDSRRRIVHASSVSGEHTPLACWFGSRAETHVSTVRDRRKFTASCRQLRETACAPRISAALPFSCLCVLGVWDLVL